MFSATKFIDFFVHDILDYTMLNKNAKQFIKQMDVFNLRNAIHEIIEIQEDKIKMKHIAIQTIFRGFNSSDYLVNTDQKRL